MDILLYLITLTIGILIGSKNLLEKSIVKNLDRIQTVSILLLLFIMGVNIGMSKEVVASFAVIGKQALILAIFSIIFSILCVRAVSGYILASKEAREKSDC